MHSKHKRETEKSALANRTNYTLIWSAFHDLRGTMPTTLFHDVN